MRITMMVTEVEACRRLRIATATDGDMAIPRSRKLGEASTGTDVEELWEIGIGSL